jgi:hypothetical protein
MTCATMWWSTWGRTGRCWSSMRPAISKKGTSTVGVQRQYTGTAGRIANAQVAVYLVYATDAGHALIDRELYLPRCRIEDPVRLQAAGVPRARRVATKPALATAMLGRALEAGVPVAWVTGDEVYGANPGLRAELEASGVGSVLAVACDHRVAFGGASRPADALLGKVPARAWQCVSAGKGAKGHRLYERAFLRLDAAPGGQPGQHWLMPPPPADRRAGLLPLLDARACAAGRPGRGRRAALEDRGTLPDRQGPGRPGPASGPPLAFLGPLDHPGPGCPRLAGGGRQHRTGSPPFTIRAGLVDLQRGPAPARHAGCPSCR